MLSKVRSILFHTIKRNCHASNLRFTDIQPCNDKIINVNEPFGNGYDKFKLILDVRSAQEFQIDHLPNAINIPILNDEERIVVGKIYESCTFHYSPHSSTVPNMFSESATGQISWIFLDNEQSRQIYSTGTDFIWSFTKKYHKWWRPDFGLLLARWSTKQIRGISSFRDIGEQATGLHFEWGIQILPETGYRQSITTVQSHNVYGHLWAHW